VVGEAWKGGTRRVLVAAMLVLVLAAIMLALPKSALAALPSEIPDRTSMVDGRVRAIEQVGSNIWLGGSFSHVETREGRVLGNVDNLAVLDAQTGRPRDIAPNLGGPGDEVFDMAVFRGDVLIAGKFPGPSSKKENLVRVDGATGKVVRWYDAPSLKAVLAAPKLKRVYGGGISLSAFNSGTGEELWTRARTSINPAIRAHDSKPAYRDLELDGNTIWAACICDAVNGKPAKALVKLTNTGRHVTSWYTEAGKAAFGESLVVRKGKLYLGAGGSDFVAEFDKARGGARGWVRDTSGSTQAIEIMDGRLVIGGHFYYAADQPGDRCGEGRPGDTNAQGKPTLNPNGDCLRRQGIAAYSFGGDLARVWSPTYSGSYSLVWALHVQGNTLHTGGQFKKVNGVVQNSYARLSPAGL
jgi:putative pyrroloquinoline-quinone binding quinoprotein